MRLVLTSDTHYGISSLDFLDDLSLERPDVVVHAGDWASNKQEQFRQSLETFRRKLSCPILCVRGNHDFWQAGLKKLPISEIYEQHERWFADYGIHHLDAPFKLGGYVIAGFDGWYGRSSVASNDAFHLPDWVEGTPAMEWFSRKAYVDLARCVRKVSDLPEKKICVSHFPSFSEDTRYTSFCANAHYLSILKDSFDMVLYGHSHRRCDFLYEDSLRVVNCGSDYGSPRYVVLEL